MQSVLHLFKQLFSPDQLQHLLQEWGWVAYIVLFVIVFAETGLLVGFCLPGDSLLFIAGFVCSIVTPTGHALEFAWLCPLLIFAAVAGDTVGYWLGRKAGPMIFCREDSLFFHRAHLVRTHRFFERYGGKTIIYARFVPIVRTFAPFVAGIGNMNYLRFLKFNVWGGIGWITGMLLLGYWFGNIPIVKHNLEKAVLVVIFISLLPVFIEVARSHFRKGDEEQEDMNVDPNRPPEISIE